MLRVCPWLLLVAALILYLSSQLSAKVSHYGTGGEPSCDVFHVCRDNLREIFCPHPFNNLFEFLNLKNNFIVDIKRWHFSGPFKVIAMYSRWGSSRKMQLIMKWWSNDMKIKYKKSTWRKSRGLKLQCEHTFCQVKGMCILW